MATSKKEAITETYETTCKNLAEYAVNRDDIKDLVLTLPKDQNINTVTVEYELQILKIVSVGWSLNVNMENHPKKLAVSEMFWNHIREFSKEISNVTGLMIGHEIDYFEILKERFNVYVKSLDMCVKDSDPASAIGPAFAEICKANDNTFTIITGSRIFNYSVRATKEYLDSLGIGI
jgi:hypothetical protein